MAEPRFGSDDDLPRTLRRAREERERELRELHGANEPSLAPGSHAGTPHGAADVPRPHDPAPPLGLAPHSGTIRRFEVPFMHLVGFFMKAVFAAIPALLVLSLVLWLGGQALKTFFPSLGRMQIKIEFVGPETPAPTASAPAAPSPPAAQKR
jgi:hypothetical protein